MNKALDVFVVTLVGVAAVVGGVCLAAIAVLLAAMPYIIIGGGLYGGYMLVRWLVG